MLFLLLLQVLSTFQAMYIKKSDMRPKGDPETAIFMGSAL